GAEYRLKEVPLKSGAKESRRLSLGAPYCRSGRFLSATGFATLVVPSSAPGSSMLAFCLYLSLIPEGDVVRSRRICASSSCATVDQDVSIFSSLSAISPFTPGIL